MSRLALLVLLVLLPSMAQAAITCSASDFNSAGTSTDPAELPLTVPSNTYQRTFLAVLDRTESEATPTVTDTGGGTWTLKDGPLNSANTTVVRVWFWERSGGSTGSITISVDWSTAINAVLTAGTCSSNTANFSYVSSASMTDHNNTTTWAANGMAFSGEGVIIGYTGQNTNTTMTPGGSETILNTSTSRQHMISLTGNSGTGTQSATMSVSATGIWGASLYQEDTGVTCRGSLLLMGVGGC